MQNIFAFFSLYKEKITPKPIAAGSEGGIAIVSKSKILFARKDPDNPFFIKTGIKQKNPRKAKAASKKMNL